jgi:hypothetical protein
MILIFNQKMIISFVIFYYIISEFQSMHIILAKNKFEYKKKVKWLLKNEINEIIFNYYFIKY